MSQQQYVLVPATQVVILISMFFITSIICLSVPVATLQGLFMIPLHLIFLIILSCNRLSVEAIYNTIQNPDTHVLDVADKVDRVHLTAFVGIGVLYPCLVHTGYLHMLSFYINGMAFLLQGCLMSTHKTFFSVCNTLGHAYLIPYAFEHDEDWIRILILSMSLIKLTIIDQVISVRRNRWAYRILHVILGIIETGQIAGFMHLYHAKIHQHSLTDETIELLPKSLSIFFSNMQAAVNRHM